MGFIYIIDVTNRDGVQTARLGLSKLEKTMLNLYLNEMGVFQSEFGFPTTRHEVNYLKANIELAEMGVLAPIRLQGWLRAVAGDVETAFKRIPDLKHVNLSISTSEQMINGKFRGSKNADDIIEMAAEALDVARSYGAGTVGVNAEDASRTDINYLVKFARTMKDHGASRIRYCDTLGYDNPFTIYEATKTLAENVGLPIEIHCHGDLGMAVANSIAGAKGVIDGGQDVFINTTVNGIGERAGNADLVAVLLAIMKSKDFSERYELGNQMDLSKSWKIAKFASYAFGVPIPMNQPGVGANAFAHASGIHADGVIKDPANYELYGFEELGRGEPEMVETGSEIISSQYGGIRGFRHIMDSTEEGETSYEFKDSTEAEKVLELVRYANVLSQKPLVEDELLFIARYPEIAAKLMIIDPRYE